MVIIWVIVQHLMVLDRPRDVLANHAAYETMKLCDEDRDWLAQKYPAEQYECRTLGIVPKDLEN